MTPVPKEHKDKKDKKEQFSCQDALCKNMLESGHHGLQCAQGHHFCPECSQDYMSAVLSDPAEFLAPDGTKCPECKCLYKLEVVQRVLTNEQLPDFEAKMFEYVDAQNICGESEEFVKCPLCPYVEITPKSRGISLFCCQRCGETTCNVCKHKLTKFESDELDLSDDELVADQTTSEGQYMRHARCKELEVLKARFDQVIEYAATRRCPTCGVAGMKDEACTHMVCGDCQTTWCYVCGLPENQCDKEDPKGNIYSHNADWRENERRCPWFLEGICEVRVDLRTNYFMFTHCEVLSVDNRAHFAD